MSKGNFVGFQQKIEIPEGFELLEINDEIESSLGKDELFSWLSKSESISQWFYIVSKLDLRSGGKIDFINANGATSQAVCTSISFGKEISMLADEFGNFKARVTKSKSNFKIELNFKILTDDSDAKSKEILPLISKLKLLVS
ncbi:unannotated protein [freshwater metagenome]|uniref:Unannotated protein n=1 Tax=freshwater metagenome TaxID=449393 RepID=A0A6J7EG86_9ZZZZ|nr:hypothetical protein [Actinomycetota bacterium]